MFYGGQRHYTDDKMFYFQAVQMPISDLWCAALFFKAVNPLTDQAGEYTFCPDEVSVHDLPDSNTADRVAKAMQLLYDKARDGWREEMREKRFDLERKVADLLKTELNDL